MAVDVVIGAVTFSGSLIASGKLQGVVASRPVAFPGVWARRSASWSAEDAAIQLAYVSRVIIVPGYGLAVP